MQILIEDFLSLSTTFCSLLLLLNHQETFWGGENILPLLLGPKCLNWYFLHGFCSRFRQVQNIRARRTLGEMYQANSWRVYSEQSQSYRDRAMSRPPDSPWLCLFSLPLSFSRTEELPSPHIQASCEWILNGTASSQPPD